MKRAGLAVLAALALLLAFTPFGCSAKHSPTLPAVNVPPVIVAVSPPAKGTGVLYDSEIWAQFDRALDPASVETTTVFLKIDTRRLPIQVSYEALTRRIRITPRAILALQQTYTIALSPNLRAKDGGVLGVTQSWQFTTNSIHRLHLDYPVYGSLESPFAALSWSGNGLPTDGIFYDVYAGTDSTAVANRTVPPVQTTLFLIALPTTRWPLGSRVYWAVTTRNTLTGEQLIGPLSAFEVLPASTPTITVDLPVQDYGGLQNTRTASQLCNSQTLFSGAAYNCGMRWALNGNLPNLRLADATIGIYANAGGAGTALSTVPQLFSAQNPWANACGFAYPGPPYANANGALATGTNPPGNTALISYHADLLTSFIEQMARRGTVYGFLLRSAQTAGYQSPNAPQPPVMHLTEYQLPASLRAR